MKVLYTKYPGGPQLKPPRPVVGNLRQIDAQLCFSRVKMRAEDGTGKKPWGWRTKICGELCHDVFVYLPNGFLVGHWDATLGGYRDIPKMIAPWTLKDKK